ncbi:MAG: hypothetical protein EOO01_44490, partial [Chitinophagaceae bacterium]
PEQILEQNPLENLKDESILREASVFIFLGFCKKGVADFFAIYAENLYSEPSWKAASALFVRYYLDFSGYSDMAMGVGLMFGIRLPLNFNLPYISQSIAEYWRRWHISLGEWFRTNVFFPLQFKLTRNGAWRTNKLLLRLTGPIASFTTMFLIGMWHGLSGVFFIWAIFNAILILISEPAAKGLHKLIGLAAVPLNILVTIYLVFVGQLLINAPNVSKFSATYLKLHWRSSSTAAEPSRLILAAVLAIMIFHIIDYLILHRKIWKNTYILFILLGLLMFCSFVTFKTGQPFVYGSF